MKLFVVLRQSGLVDVFLVNFVHICNGLPDNLALEKKYWRFPLEKTKTTKNKKQPKKNITHDEIQIHACLNKLKEKQ